MTDEQIEQAAGEYAAKTAEQYEVCNSEFVQEVAVAFERGAQYSLSHQWVAVEERLPENEHLVYAAFPIEGHLTARLAFYSHKYDRWISFPGTCTLSDVVFWMEIPAIPQLNH